jgi:HEAT repeat protein
MSIEIHCEQCQKRYRVKADLAGKRVRCSNCGSPVSVPDGLEQTGEDALPDAPGESKFAQEIPADTPPQVKRPAPPKAAPPKAAPPPVPKQVVRFDPRFDPQAMTDMPAPQPPGVPQAPKPAPQRTPQSASKKVERQPADRDIGFADEDPLFMSKPRVADYDNLADTADAPAISDDSPEPRLDQEPTIPRGRRGSGKLADTDVTPAEPDLEIPGPSERPIFSMPADNEVMKKFRAEQAAGQNRRCTGCGGPMKVGAVICLNCGFNAATGERGGDGSGDWDEAGEGSTTLWSKLFGKANWKPEDRALRKLAILGVLLCFVPLIGLKVPLLVRPGIYIAYAGLALAILSAGLFAKRMRFTRAAVAAAAGLIAFAVYSNLRPIDLDDHLTRADDTPRRDAPRPMKSGNDGNRVKPAPGDAPTSEVMLILKGPAEGIDPVNWYVNYLGHADARVRFKSANYLIANTPAGRKEEVARVFEGRLNDEHPQMRRLAIKGVALYIDDHTTGVLTPLLKDEEEEVRGDVYQLLAKLKDTKALPAIVARMSDDGTLAREALAAFDASQKPAITRAFELSLKSDNARQRELACRELATYGGPNTPGLLLGLLDDPDLGVRCAAVLTLGKLKDPRTLDAIMTRLIYDRTAAMAALEAFGSGAEKPVLSLLKTGNTEMRLAAAEVLGTIGTKECIPALHDAAVDNDARLAATAKDAWRKIAPDDFTPSMESIVDMESEITSRQRAGLERLAELKPDKHQDQVAKALVRSAMSDDLLVREAAQKALPIWGTRDTAPAFMELLGEKIHPARRQLAEMALGALKDPRGAAAVARWASVDYPVAMQSLADMGPVAEDAVIDLLVHERTDIQREAIKILKLWGTRQKAIPALQGVLTRERARLGNEVLDAIDAINRRPIVPRKPLTQPAR